MNCSVCVFKLNKNMDAQSVLSLKKQYYPFIVLMLFQKSSFLNPETENYKESKG